MRVSKYSASGNDFIIFHTFVEKNRADLAQQICNRTQGVGADGLIVLLPSKEYDFKWQFYNSDGSVANMCGNGSRATAHYAFKNGLVTNNRFRFETLAGTIEAHVEEDIVESELTPYKILQDDFVYEGYNCWIVDTGVPHVVITVDDVDSFNLEIAKTLRKQYNANVNFFEEREDFLRVRTFERGVEGETLACGTGMAACFLKTALGKDATKIVVPKSNEKLTLKHYNSRLYLKGSVQKIFDTFITLP